ncbi:MAG TPA: sensor histidine kinase, partial [Longimicrobiaceae bacterium]|nr:sensor histidine kinase [Longimicrobiaceae bacterium]
KLLPEHTSAPPGMGTLASEIDSLRETPAGGRRRSVRALLSWRWTGAVLGFWTVTALFLVSQMYLLRMARGEEFHAGAAFSGAFIDMYLWAAMTIAAFALVRLLPLERGRWMRPLLLQLLAGVLLVSLRLGIDYLVINWSPWMESRPFAVVFFSRSPHVLIWYLMIVGIGYGIEFFLRYRARELSASQLETQLTRAQLQMLKMQLHPHFLFNTLHAISTLVHRDPDGAERMIASLSELLRATLTHGQAQEVTVREELEFLAPYLEIEQTRFGERLRVEVEVDPQVLEARIPHLILQPLVENAIRHGIAPRRSVGRIEISAARGNGHLHVCVRDNGVGMPALESSAGNGAAGQANGHAGGRNGGVGLANTRARLDRLYGAEHRFEVRSASEGGTVVDLSIPFRTASNGHAPHKSAAGGVRAG